MTNNKLRPVSVSFANDGDGHYDESPYFSEHGEYYFREDVDLLVRDLTSRLAEVERERDAFKKDAERVDFLERMSRNAGWHQENGTFAFCIDDVFVTKGTFRDALDAAMSADSATGEER